MKTQTHTPGPWHTNGVLIMNEKGSTVGRVGHIENYEANAHLIALAPELLEVCKEMYKILPVADPKWIEVMKKAEGRI